MQPLKFQRSTKTHVAAVESESFRVAMRRLPGGVSIITSGQGSDRSGMTATSLSSLSVDPPSLIVSINRDASIRPILDRYKAFGASVLRAGQKSVADRFAGIGGLKGNGRFIGERWIALETGAPLLATALAVFDCEVEDIIDRHTHSIIIGLSRPYRYRLKAPRWFTGRGNTPHPALESLKSTTIGKGRERAP